LQTPANKTARDAGKSRIRPTADRAREALFSIIGREVENATVLDLFAGTGALGLEALSRSAHLAVFVDSDPEAVRIINKNIEICGFSDRAVVLKRDLSKGLYFLTRQLPETLFPIVFIDPPYRKGMAGKMLQEIAGGKFLSSEALVVVEEDALTEMESRVAGLNLVDQRRYGDTRFWFYRKDNP
jgi:16S rRNA (guanine966-N2)-methyltransferase